MAAATAAPAVTPLRVARYTVTGAWELVPAPPQLASWRIAAACTALLPGHTVGVLQEENPPASTADPADAADLPWMPKPFCYVLYPNTGAQRVLAVWRGGPHAGPVLEVPNPPCVMLPAVVSALVDLTPDMLYNIQAAASALDPTACAHAVCNDAMWMQELQQAHPATTHQHAASVEDATTVPVVSLDVALSSLAAHGVVAPAAKLLSQLSGPPVPVAVPDISHGGGAGKPARAPPHKDARARRGEGAPGPVTGAGAGAAAGSAATCDVDMDGDDSDSHSDGSRRGDSDDNSGGDSDDDADADGDGGIGGLVALREDDDGGDGDEECDADGDLDAVPAVLDDDDDDNASNGNDSDGGLFGFDGGDGDDDGDD